MPDPIDEAVAAAGAQPIQAPDLSQNVTIPVLIQGSGRGAVINVPPDITDAELLELVTWLTIPAGGLRSLLESNRGPRLVVARGRIDG